MTKARMASPDDTARRSRPVTGFERPEISDRLTPASTAKSADALPPANCCVSVIPSSPVEFKMCVAIIPIRARHRATSRPTTRPVATKGVNTRGSTYVEADHPVVVRVGRRRPTVVVAGGDPQRAVGCRGHRTDPAEVAVEESPLRSSVRAGQPDRVEACACEGAEPGPAVGDGDATR